MYKKRNHTLGIVLLFIGGFLLLSNLLEISIKDNILILIGLAFMTGYYFKRNTGYLIAGIIILAIGISQIVDTYNLLRVDISGTIFLLGLGTAFLIIYFVKKIRGFIYGGFFLIAIGFSRLVNEIYGYDLFWVFALFIGVVFYLIYLIETRKSNKKWPLIVGTIFIVISLISYLTVEDVIATSVWEALSYIWPVLIILIGLKIVYNNIKIKK